MFRHYLSNMFEWADERARMYVAGEVCFGPDVAGVTSAIKKSGVYQANPEHGQRNLYLFGAGSACERTTGPCAHKPFRACPEVDLNEYKTALKVVFGQHGQHD
jgi:hypothetical protein